MKRSVVQGGLSALLLLGMLFFSAYRHNSAQADRGLSTATAASHSPELSNRSHNLLPFAIGEERIPGGNQVNYARASWLKSKLPAALVADEALLLKDVPAALYAAATPLRPLGLSPPDIIYPFHYFW